MQQMGDAQVLLVSMIAVGLPLLVSSVVLPTTLYLNKTRAQLCCKRPQISFQPTSLHKSHFVMHGVALLGKVGC